MSEEMTSNDEGSYSNFIINIMICTSIFLMVSVPLRLKLNKWAYFIGIIISMFLINFGFTFYKVLHYDNSWYTQRYHYNTSHLTEEAANDIFNNMKEGFFSFFTYGNIKNNTKNFVGYIYGPMKGIGKGIKNFFIGEPKCCYRTTRKRHR